MEKRELTWQRYKLKAQQAIMEVIITDRENPYDRYENCKYVLDNFHLFHEENRGIALAELRYLATTDTEEDGHLYNVQIDACIYLLSQKFSGNSEEDIKRIAETIMDAVSLGKLRGHLAACKYVLEHPCPTKTKEQKEE